MNFGEFVTGILLALSMAGVANLTFVTIITPVVLYYLCVFGLAILVGLCTTIFAGLSKWKK